MAEDIVSVRSLRLYELLGATLVAVIQADALAAKTTLEYIETIGFLPPASDGDADAAAGTSDGGSLRMAAFRYSKRDENDEISEFVAEVPILSLVPIPALQVDTATFSFAVKIDDITKVTNGVTTPATEPAAQPAARLVRWLQPTSTQLIARPAASSGARSQEVRSTHHLEVEVKMKQADIPVGMEKIFNLLDQAIKDRKTP